MGFPVGPSSGLNYRGAMIAARSIRPAKIVTVLPDRMERYFSSELFATVRGNPEPVTLRAERRRSDSCTARCRRSRRRSIRPTSAWRRPHWRRSGARRRSWRLRPVGAPVENRHPASWRQHTGRLSQSRRAVVQFVPDVSQEDQIAACGSQVRGAGGASNQFDVPGRARLC